MTFDWSIQVDRSGYSIRCSASSVCRSNPSPNRRLDIDSSLATLINPALSPRGRFLSRKPLHQSHFAAHEDLYHEIGVEILERGWNVITFEGPGQPTVLRDENLGFIPDWWNVVSPVVDYLETRPDVDLGHIALAGVSFGGQLIPLAASREPRLSAVLAIDGMTSMYDIFEAGFAASNITKLYDAGDYAKFDEEILAIEQDPSEATSLRWILAQSLFTFNTDSPSDWWGRLDEFTVNATIVGEYLLSGVCWRGGE